MAGSLEQEVDTLTSFDVAPQHRPRPLPLFLALLRSETEGAPQRMRDALAGLRAYQEASRSPRPPANIALSHGRVTVREYGGSGPPVLVVPSLINASDVLDLTSGTSLMRWLADQGFRPLLVDWGSPDSDESDLSIAGHVERYLLPLIDRIEAAPIVVGYCLGGTMAAAAAVQREVAGLAMIAAPWNFRGYSDETRDFLDSLWRGAAPTVDRLGMFPIELLQTGFWGLDPARTIAKFERFGRMAPDSAEARNFVALEDWANAGAPLTGAAGRELLQDFVGEDRPGSGAWRVAGSVVDPAAVRCPVLNIVSTTDRIVPAATAASTGEQMVLALGHVGMIVGGSARTAMWEPLARWLTQVRPA